MRLMTAAAVMVLAIILVVLWLLEPVAPLPARYTLADCKRVALIDAQTGGSIVGAEDLALLGDGDSLLVSAHDRRDPEMRDGGLYRVSLWGIRGAERYEASNLIDLDTRQEAFRPHGIAVSQTGERIALVNRVGPQQTIIEIGSIEDETWAPAKRLTGNSLCRANDLNFVQAEVETLEISLDRQSCGFSFSDVVPGSTTGRTALWDGGRLQISRTGLAFPNGISGEYVAETRKNRILRPAGEPIRVPGGPDNITREDRRMLVVAVHPSLRRLWLYLNGAWPSAPSRVVRVNVLSSAVEVLFDDPSGEMFSGATSAVLVDDKLIMGSVADEGLLICQKGGA